MDSADGVLITQIAAGDAEALHALYTRYRPHLFRYFWVQCAGDGGAVDDLVQETFLAIWRTAAHFRGQAQVRTWIFGIAHNIAVRHRGKRQATLLSLDNLTDEALSDDAPPLEAHLIARLALQDALYHLTEKQREALSLVYHQGFTLDEVAQILSIPLGTIKSRLHDARAALARILAAEEAHQ